LPITRPGDIGLRTGLLDDRGVVDTVDDLFAVDFGRGVLLDAIGFSWSPSRAMINRCCAADKRGRVLAKCSGAYLCQ
jgi:hypothetical protein